MPDVALTIAEPGQRGVLESLFQLYIHDFSAFWAGTPQGELGEDGRFAPYPLGPYWAGKGWVPLLIRVDGALAGFALLNPVSHAGCPLDWSMAEFFVVRKHRRSGVGGKAASAVFDRYPGVWEVAVARRNLAALAFWRRTVSAHPAVSGLRELDIQSARWNGPVLCFQVGARAGGDQADG